jgi:nucleotide-binding universal stress UspA family protein
VVPAPQLTRQGPRALREACEGHDLLAIGAGAGGSAVVEHAPIPVLVGRWSALGTEVTDTILVPVDASPESSRAVELAGRLVAAHGGRARLWGGALARPVLDGPGASRPRGT